MTYQEDDEKTIIQTGATQANNAKEEETRRVSDEANTEAAADAETCNDSADQKKSDNVWKTVTIGGIAGIMLGAGGTVLANNIALTDGEQGDDETGESNTNTTASSSHAAHHDIHMATGVNDDMSFSEAFAAARQEVGAGGAFVWHGQIYGTYYGNEWNAMSEQEHQQFSSDAVHSANEHNAIQDETHNDNLQDTSTPDPTPNPTPDPEPTPEPEPTPDPTPEPEPTPETEPTQEPEPEPEIDVHILGVEQGVEGPDGSLMNYGFAEIDGHAAVFVDADNDQSFDGVIIDVNDNNQLDDADYFAEIADDSEYTVDNFIQHIEDPLMADNDADVDYSADDAMV